MVEKYFDCWKIKDFNQIPRLQLELGLKFGLKPWIFSFNLLSDKCLIHFTKKNPKKLLVSAFQISLFFKLYLQMDVCSDS